MLKTLYIYIDEAGDFNFSPSGSMYYSLTGVITNAPCYQIEALNELKHKILSREMHPNLGMKYLEEHLCHRFHASEDQQVVRNEVFKIISGMEHLKSHSIVIQKNKTNPAIRRPENFYPKFVGSLLDYIFKRYSYSSLVIFIDSMPVNSKKEAFLKSIKQTVNHKATAFPYAIYCPKSQSNYLLQVADYINWAIFKKYESGDTRSYELIKNTLDTKERDIFKDGDYEYYSFKTK